MEIVIYGTGNLIAIAIFVSLSALPFYLFHLVGAGVGGRIKCRSLRWWLPLGMFGLVSAWAYASFMTYKNACKSVPGITSFSTPSNVPIGFTVLPAKNGHIGGMEYSPEGVLETGVFQFYDSEGGRRCIGEKAREDVSVYPITNQCDRSLRSGLVVDILPHRVSAQRWWSPPIYEAVIEVREANSNQVLAKGTDLIFGGGMVGMYLRLLGGDQDFDRLSCGFSSPVIGPWRPTLTSRPRFAEYIQADLTLLRVAAGK